VSLGKPFSTTSTTIIQEVGLDPKMTQVTKKLDEWMADPLNSLKVKGLFQMSNTKAGDISPRDRPRKMSGTTSDTSSTYNLAADLSKSIAMETDKATFAIALYWPVKCRCNIFVINSISSPLREH
jgi:hypothetical protein